MCTPPRTRLNSGNGAKDVGTINNLDRSRLNSGNSSKGQGTINNSELGNHSATVNEIMKLSDQMEEL